MHTVIKTNGLLDIVVNLTVIFTAVTAYFLP